MIDEIQRAAHRLTDELVLWDSLFKPPGPLLEMLMGPDRPPFLEPAELIRTRFSELQSARSAMREHFTESVRQRFAALSGIEGVSHAGVTAASYTESVYALAELRLDSVSTFHGLVRECTAGDELDAAMSHWEVFRDVMMRKGTVDGERLHVAIDQECRRLPGKRRLPLKDDAPRTDEPTADEIERVRRAMKAAGKDADPKRIKAALRSDNDEGVGMREQTFYAALRNVRG